MYIFDLRQHILNTIQLNVLATKYNSWFTGQKKAW